METLFLYVYIIVVLINDDWKNSKKLSIDTLTHVWQVQLYQSFVE